MSTRMSKIIFGLMLMVVIATSVIGSCAPAPEAISSLDTTTLVREIDAQAGVVCYKFKYVDGISCLPISETDLSVSRTY